MNTAAVVIQIVIVVIAVAVVALLGRRRSAARLRERFGPEYDRAVHETGSAAVAHQAKLAEREKRVDKLNLRSLTPAESATSMEQWRVIQARFVDNPAAALSEADRLIGDVMQARGYPVSEFEQRATDISVEYPRVVEHYRAGHEIAIRHAQGNASTENMRQAMIHYRELFDDLVGQTTIARARAARA